MSEVTVGEATPEEGRRIFDQACREHLGVPAEEFVKYDPQSARERWDEEQLAAVLILLPFWSEPSEEIPRCEAVDDDTGLQCVLISPHTGMPHRWRAMP